MRNGVHVCGAVPLSFGLADGCTWPCSWGQGCGCGWVYMSGMVVLFPYEMLEHFGCGWVTIAVWLS